MKKTIVTRAAAFTLASSLVLPLVGCGATPVSESTSIQSAATQETSLPMETTVATTEATVEQTIPTTETTIPTEAPTESTVPPTTIFPEEEKDEFGLTEQQRNSFSMLYHLAITAENIRISKDNRLLLEDIYTSLLNDINPGAIDEITQEHLENLRTVIESYMNIAVKRDRLQYIHNQNKAAAMRSAVPNPLAILSITNAFNWKKLALTVGYTLVDSYTRYKSASDSADQDFLMSGWELDDEETETIQNNRERAFDYMVDIVQAYHLDGKMTLNERAIETFSKICTIESIPQRMQRLEAEFDTYKLLGNYWIALADCYYETGKYRECLECVDYYKQLSTGIYRNDYNYVQILPKVIIAAQNVCSGDDYVSVVGGFANDIVQNTTTDQWSLRYYAAQVYMDLYARTNERKYLQAAYNHIYNNVGVLLDEQKSLNTVYLNDIEEVEAAEPDYDYMTDQEKKEAKKEYKAEKERVKNYNNELKERRKTELPPLYEPLVLNCDLLFALADELHISNAEKKGIEAVLQTDENGIFLSNPINDRYSFFKNDNDYSIVMDKSSIKIPVSLLSENCDISVEITDDHHTVLCDDCMVTKVEREKESIDAFSAYISSEKMGDFEWSLGTRVTVKIINGDEDDPLEFRYKVTEYVDYLIWSDTVVFEEA